MITVTRSGRNYTSNVEYKPPRVPDTPEVEELKMYAELTRKLPTCSKCKKPGERYSKTDSWCKDCKKQYIRRYQAQHKEQTRKAKSLYAEMNREKVAISKTLYRERNRNKLRKKSSEYQKKNKKIVLSRCREYQARKLKACPNWLTEEQLLEIKLLYKNCQVGFHVDHIVPLKGKDVSGLHVPWNLQYLTASDNRRKSNKS